MRVELMVNGERREADVWGGESLLTMLRDRLELPGSKNACEQGECGSCSVLVDGELVCSCLVLAAQADGHEVVTVEGLAGGSELHPVQEAFADAGAVQCGFCTPGFVVAAARSPSARPRSQRRRDPRGALREPLPLYRVPEDPRCGSPGGRAVSIADAGAPSRTRCHDRAPMPMLSRRSAGSSPTRATCTLPGCSGDTRFGALTHTRGSSRSTCPMRSRSPASTRCSRTRTSLAGRRTGSSFADQPVLAIDRVRYFGEAVAIVAAEEPEQARRAAAAVRVEYRAARARHRPGAGDGDGAAPSRPADDGARLSRRSATERRPLARDPPRRSRRARRTSRSRASTTSGQQDQAFLGPESGIAIPDGEGGVDIHVATQWLHVDRDQVAPCLDLEPEQVRIHLAGVGGAFGGREDLSMQIHAALLALRTGRPVKIVYNREESFVGHIHRHPARIWAEHRATREGRLVAVRMRVLLDGGAYASSSTAVHLERVLVRSRPVRGRERPRSTGSPSTRTIRRAARCAASAQCRPASRPKARWTSSPQRSTSTRSSSGS